MELTVGEQVYTLTAGEALTIPGGIPHEARAVTDCTIIDAFSPRRDDLV
jgi:quercetin dioxygenase-like cupin family protein